MVEEPSPPSNVPVQPQTKTSRKYFLKKSKTKRVYTLELISQHLLESCLHFVSDESIFRTLVQVLLKFAVRVGDGV